MSPRPRREERHPDLLTAIKDTAWQQIAELGATALNLRAIARDLGITAPSIYNYFPNRDALVTAMIVDAYNSLADSQEEALRAHPGEAHDATAAHLSALGLAYRQWAVSYPQRYQLIFGTPIPNYHAPEEITLPAAARALIPLTRTIQNIYSAGKLRTERLAPLTARLEAMLNAWRAFEGSADLEVLYLSLVVWSRVHGLVMLEIGSHIPSFIDDPAELSRREINNLIIQYL